MNKWHKLRENKSIDWKAMNKKSALTLGSIGSVLVILIIIIAFVMTGQHKTNSQSSSTKLPKINQAKVMKRVDYEMFSMSDDGRYVENVDNEPTYVDGEKVGERSITSMVYVSATGKETPSDGAGNYNTFQPRH